MKLERVLLKDVVTELLPLLKEHWQEVARYKDSIKLEPNWDYYLTLEEHNRLVLVVARKDEKIVGYSCYILTEHPHYASILTAQNDVIFLLPECRVGRNALKLLKFAEEELKKEDVNLIIHRVKKEKNFGTLLQHLGHDEHEVVFTKFLE